MNQVQSDNYNWELFITQYKNVKKHFVDHEYTKLADIFSFYEKWTINNVSSAIGLVNGVILNESFVEKTLKWVSKISKPIGDALKKRYLSIVMEKDVEASNILQIFKSNFLNHIPTSEAAVERVFSRHKLIHSQIRNSLKAGTVDSMLFVRYNVSYLYKSIFADKMEEDDCIELTDDHNIPLI